MDIETLLKLDKLMESTSVVASYSGLPFDLLFFIKDRIEQSPGVFIFVVYGSNYPNLVLSVKSNGDIIDNVEFRKFLQHYAEHIKVVRSFLKVNCELIFNYWNDVINEYEFNISLDYSPFGKTHNNPYLDNGLKGTMMKKTEKEKIVIFTGSGISAESGLKTFRDNGGLWCNHRVEEVATPEAFAEDPKLVLDFYNYRRSELKKAKPNAAHIAIAKLQQKYDVTIITQNVDDLHEQAGSEHVIHLHGELVKACSSKDKSCVVNIGHKEINLGDKAADGSQLRPYIVWFGEMVPMMSIATEVTHQADKFLVVGTSLQVYPAAGLVYEVSDDCEKGLVSLECDHVPDDYTFIKESASVGVPNLVEEWLK